MQPYYKPLRTNHEEVSSESNCNECLMGCIAQKGSEQVNTALGGKLCYLRERPALIRDEAQLYGDYKGMKFRTEWGLQEVSLQSLSGITEVESKPCDPHLPEKTGKQPGVT